MKLGPSTALGASLLLCAAAIPLAAQPQDEPATVTIALDDSGASTRLVLTHSRHVTRAVFLGRQGIEVLYAQPVILEPAALRVEDGILDGWTLHEGRRLVFERGAGFHYYETYELNNPDRLVLDLHGERSSPKARTGQEPDGGGPTVIVIDPGHGGSESGAIGPTGLREKDITLDLATRLKRALDQDPSVSVVLTRDDDRHVDLDERTAIANHNRADLFLSIHLNSSPRTGAFGAETYFLSAEATDDEARTLAALESRTFGVDTESAGGDTLDLILWDLAQNRYLAQSSALAESVQRHMNELTGTRDRGVRQAPFRVLMGATMPAILVEVGFISNPDEESRFRGLSYRSRVVEAIAAAVGEFRQRHERLSAPVPGGASPPAGR